VEKLKYNNSQAILSQYQLNNNFNGQQNQQHHQSLLTLIPQDTQHPAQLAPPQSSSTINILNRNTNNLETITFEPESFVTREIADSFVNNLESLVHNLENDSFNPNHDNVNNQTTTTTTTHQSFTLINQMEVTRQRREKNAPREFKCNVCSKVFKYKQRLERHEKIHNGIKPFICEYCAKPFRELSNLVLHVKVHFRAI
jgi:stress-induced morphogen